ARHVLDHPALVAGKTVLDFASGSGLVGIAARMAGASKVLAADIDPWSETAIRLNAGLNGVTLDHMSDDLIGRDGGWDVVLAGDVFYDRGFADLLIPWFSALAARG
ncbi:class I SAM-dependent methyltransferase, partial [Shinella zoogloeoides]